MTIEALNSLGPEEAEARFRDCCAANPWIQGMLDADPMPALKPSYPVAMNSGQS